MLDSIALMNGMTQKMDYLQTRQRVMAQNITHSDTPGYQAMDVKAPDFKRTLGRYINPNQTNNGERLSLATPKDGMVPHLQMLNRVDNGNRVRQPYEIAPAKNAVNLEEQMLQASQTAIDYQLVTNLYNKNVDLLRAAIRTQ